MRDSFLKRGPRWRPMLALALVTGCARDAEGPPRDAGPPPVVLDASSLKPGAPLECGDVTCALPDASGPFGAHACCLPGGGCGTMPELVPGACLAGRGPGSVDLACATSALPDGTEIPGCCTGEGRCGLYDRFGGFGCVPSLLPDGGTGGARCRYVPDLDCHRVVEMPCDGPEDCADGGVCCGRASRGELDAFGCFESCTVRSQTSAEPWLEICHLGGPCSTLGELCAPAADLPRGSGRCVVATLGEAGLPDAAAPTNGVSCGDAICASGESCCLRDPALPYCARPGDGCRCSGASD